jgi:hypothetical protein
MHCSLFERKVVDILLHTDINNYLETKSEINYRSICSKLVNYDGVCTINIPVENAFVIAIPSMIYMKYTNNRSDN